MRRFCEAVHERALGVRAVLAAYPWSGHQFLDPDVGATEVRAIVGDRDGWVSPQQVQDQVRFVRAAGRGDVVAFRKELERGARVNERTPNVKPH